MVHGNLGILGRAKIYLSPNYEDGIQWGDSDSDCDYVSEECTLQDTDEDLLDRWTENGPIMLISLFCQTLVVQNASISAYRTL